jgi:hypothetical protein
VWQAGRAHRYQKKALIGNLDRPGTRSTQETVETLEHAFPRLAEGVVIPHGMYDLRQQHGSVT